MVTWRDDLYKLHNNWMGNIPQGSIEDIRFKTLALTGEVGELANLAKKEWRGDDIPDVWKQFESELADVCIYLEMLKQSFGFVGDAFDSVIAKKTHELMQRFPVPVSLIEDF